MTNTKEQTKNKVVAKLTKGGINVNTVNHMVALHFDYVYNTYNTVSVMCNAISAIYAK